MQSKTQNTSQPDDFSDILTSGDGFCRLSVRAKPNARQTGLALLTLSDQSRVVEVKINAAPEDGRANKAICEALAAALHLKKSAVTIKAGDTNRQKLIEIQLSAPHTANSLKNWLSTLPHVQK